MRKFIPSRGDVIVVVGFGLFFAGMWRVSPNAALILAGAALMAYALVALK